MAYGKNAPFGLRPLCSITGGAWAGKMNVYNIAAKTDGTATYAGKIFTGDPVIWNTAKDLGGAEVGGGTIARYAPNHVDQDTAANKTPVLGVFNGCEYTLATGELVKSAYWPGGVAVMPGSLIKAYVIDDPNIIWDIQVSAVDNTLDDAKFTRDKVGGNFGFGIGGGGANLGSANNPTDGTTRTGQSAFYLSTHFTANGSAVASYLPLKVIGYTEKPDNEPATYTVGTTAPFLNVKVIINNHVFKAGVEGRAIN